MNKQIIHTDAAPAALGPYSQGVSTGPIGSSSMLYTAGQAAVDPVTRKLIDGDVSAQTHQTMQNLNAVLEEGGTSMDNVVKTNVYLVDMADFGAMNAVYASYFGPTPPARTTVAVAQLPLGALVEIEMVAIVPA